MGVQSFDDWAAEVRLVREEQLASLVRAEDGPVIGVEAVHFLERFRSASKEPLVSALGGFPMSLEGSIANHVKELQSIGCKVWFYFDGLDCVFESGSSTTSINAMRTVSDAFNIYEDASNPLKAVDRFKQADFPDVPSLIPFTKFVLHKYDIPFVVAPFKAHAQMMHHLEEGIIDAVYGSSELFLFGAEKLITKVNLFHQPATHESEEANGVMKKESMEFSVDKSSFSWIERDACLKALGDISPEAFCDALLAAGSSYIGAFPPLRNNQSVNFRHVVDLFVQCHFDVHRLCALYQHDEHLVQSKWEDRFMQVYVAIQNMMVLYSYDSVKPRSVANPARFGRVPRDLHLIVGLELPEELLYYVYNGLIGPRVINWLVNGKIRIDAPMAGGESKEYRKLVKEQLQPWRQQALASLAHTLNRWFQIREIETTYWFGDNPQKFNMKDLTSPVETIASWRVKSDVLNERNKQLGEKPGRGPGSLHFAVLALVDADFAKKTISSKPATYDPLKTAEEVVSSTIWRTLYLREYVDKSHQLTKWGTILSKALGGIGPHATREHVEAVFLSIELLRLGLLNSDEMLSNSSKAAYAGTELDKKNTRLVSRVACTGKMRHPVKGYSGPLSRPLLAYRWLVSEVRSALRDLFETTLAVLFLEASAERVRDDYTKIAEMLPFQEDYSAGLGVITKTYFDELVGMPDPTDAQCQSDIMNRAEGWFVHIDVSNSFKDACTLWQAVLAAVTAADEVTEGQDRSEWEEAGKWVASRT